MLIQLLYIFRIRQQKGCAKNIFLPFLIAGTWLLGKRFGAKALIGAVSTVEEILR